MLPFVAGDIDVIFIPRDGGYREPDHLTLKSLGLPHVCDLLGGRHGDGTGLLPSYNCYAAA